MARVLLAGESWISQATHIKGFDEFSSTTFHTGAKVLVSWRMIIAAVVNNATQIAVSDMRTWPARRWSALSPPTKTSRSSRS